VCADRETEAGDQADAVSQEASFRLRTKFSTHLIILFRLTLQERSLRGPPHRSSVRLVAEERLLLHDLLLLLLHRLMRLTRRRAVDRISPRLNLAERHARLLLLLWVGVLSVRVVEVGKVVRVRRQRRRKDLGTTTVEPKVGVRVGDGVYVGVGVVGGGRNERRVKHETAAVAVERLVLVVVLRSRVRVLLVVLALRKVTVLMLLVLLVLKPRRRLEVEVDTGISARKGVLVLDEMTGAGARPPSRAARSAAVSP
jgi:hypothetical protein